MKRIDETQVRHMAHLGRLELSEEEVARYTQDLETILNYASRLPDLHDHADLSDLRVEEDKAEVRENTHDLLRNAVSMENGYVKVPAILDKGDQ